MILLGFEEARSIHMAHLSERQPIEILMIYGYGNRKRTQSEVCTVFNGIYPHTPVSRGTICQLIKKFRDSGNVKDVKRTGRPKSATSEEKVWIGRRGSIEWPARSPDFTPLDFFLWGHVQNSVFKQRPRNLEDLKVRITAEMRRIPAEVLHRATTVEFKYRLGHCLAVNGAQFEHLI
ncbi:hypothetical protein NQ318_020182 [Aromia moschata]|uniref:DUF4817 domain-containing protein n=1 Tax=Aromia moschata TaxID=1265417 RepID=A0AAV8ZAB9_9CUCU|nr:hypothetical protein NQ318_020182 [Aromia moschata]